MKKIYLTLLFFIGCSGSDPSDPTSISCPTGYAVVPSMASVGAPDDFCVMKYEAKDDGSGNPISTDIGVPWVNINQADAKAKCQSLGLNYDLISNPEWMAIARNIENVALNWTGGSVGSGCLKRGNIGGANPCTGGDSGYDGLNPESGTGRNSLASLTLNNDEVIWDLSGNVFEWADWTLGGVLSTNIAQIDRPYVNSDSGPVLSWRELSDIDIFSVLAPAKSILPSNPNFDSSYGVGRYFSGTGIGGAPRYGGIWADGANAGVFALSLREASTSTLGHVGFRCVLRP